MDKKLGRALVHTVVICWEGISIRPSAAYTIRYPAGGVPIAEEGCASDSQSSLHIPLKK